MQLPLDWQTNRSTGKLKQIRNLNLSYRDVLNLKWKLLSRKVLISDVYTIIGRMNISDANE